MGKEKKINVLTTFFILHKSDVKTFLKSNHQCYNDIDPKTIWKKKNLNLMVRLD